MTSKECAALASRLIFPTFYSLMKRLSSLTLLGLALLLGAAGCDVFSIEDRPDPNGPSLEVILEAPTRDQISNLAVGVEAVARGNLDDYFVNVGMIGREVYRFSASDPRFTSDLLGQAMLDNNTFYTVSPWASRYRTIKNANILLDAVALVDDPNVLIEQEKSAARGFAQTFIAYELLLNLNLTYQNGVRVDVDADGNNVGPFLGYGESLSRIAGKLDSAAVDLQAAGDSTDFSFQLSGGFAGFDTPPTFFRVNRALAARVAAYREDFESVLSLLEDSFLDADGDLTTGASHVFSLDANDVANPLFFTPGATGDVLLGHPSFVDDIAENDTRRSKVLLRENAATQSGLSSQYDFFVYKTATAPIPIIRNAELLLLRAEARIQTGDLDGAEDDLNVIRSAAGLGDYDGADSQGALIEEMLRQRRFELYGEGHRWIDVRRYNPDGCSGGNEDTCLNDDLPIDREGDNVWLQFPIPQNENAGAEQ